MSRPGGGQDKVVGLYPTPLQVLAWEVAGTAISASGKFPAVALTVGVRPGSGIPVRATILATPGVPVWRGVMTKVDLQSNWGWMGRACQSKATTKADCAVGALTYLPRWQTPRLSHPNEAAGVHLGVVRGQPLRRGDDCAALTPHPAGSVGAARGLACAAVRAWRFAILTGLSRSRGAAGGGRACEDFIWLLAH